MLTPSLSLSNSYCSSFESKEKRFECLEVQGFSLILELVLRLRPLDLRREEGFASLGRVAAMAMAGWIMGVVVATGMVAQSEERR